MDAIKEFDNNFYSENLSFSVVYSKDLSLAELYRFFTTEETVVRNQMNLGFVTESGTGYYSRFAYDHKRLQKEDEEIFVDILSRIGRRAELPPVCQTIVADYEILEKALESRKISNLGGSCLFDERLFVSADGNFHVCEKINHHFSIGSADKGYDFERMSEMARQFIRLNEEQCSTCDVRFLCRRCFANLAQKGKLEITSQFCDNSKFVTLKKLDNLVRINKQKGIANAVD